MPLPPEVVRALDRLEEALDPGRGGSLARRLAALLDPEEVAATARRLVALRDAGVLPEPVGPRPFPWPLL
jgi:hypothetical protein